MDRGLFIQKLNYIHNNPISQPCDLLQYPEDYKYSSAKFYDNGIDDFGLLTHYKDQSAFVVGHKINNGGDAALLVTKSIMAETQHCWSQTNNGGRPITAKDH